VAGRIVPGEAVPGCERWQVPEVGPGGPTARQLEELQRAAWEEGFAAGRREGLERGEAEVRARVAALERVLDTLAAPLAEVDEAVERELVALAVAMARQIVRRELRTDPGEVVAAVREALAALPAGAREVRVVLHPEDAALVRERLAGGGRERAWTIEEDPALTRGGCRVVTPTSEVDATLEHRLGAVIARVLGGERDGDGGEDEGARGGGAADGAT